MAAPDHLKIQQEAEIRCVNYFTNKTTGMGPVLLVFCTAQSSTNVGKIVTCGAST